MIALFFNPWVAFAFYGLVLAAVCGLSWLSRSPVLRENAAWLALDWVAGNAIFFAAGKENSAAMMSALDVFVCLGLYENAQINSSAHRIIRLYVLGIFVTFVAYVIHREGTWEYRGAMNIVFMFTMWVGGRAAYVELANRARNIGRVLGPWRDDPSIASQSQGKA